MKLLLLILIASSIGCSKFYLLDGYVYSDPSLEPHVRAYSEFKSEYLGQEKSNYPIFFEFDDLNEPTLGRCYRPKDPQFVNNGRVIILDKPFWDNASYYKREELIFHELGHCDLNRGHTETPEIMYAYTLNSEFYKRNRETLIEFLFLGEHFARQ